jgi:hypothetical protein
MDRKIRRSNKETLERLHQQSAALLRSGKPTFHEQAEIRRSINIVTDSNERLETMALLRKALKWGIDIPNNKGWWEDDKPYTGGMTDIDMLVAIGDQRLTALGRAGVKRLIREERRKSIEWWIKVIVTVITALTGLVGALIGVFAILRK